MDGNQSNLATPMVRKYEIKVLIEIHLMLTYTENIAWGRIHSFPISKLCSLNLATLCNSGVALWRMRICCSQKVTAETQGSREKTSVSQATYKLI